MGSTTPKNALPYPVGTDRVMDGDNAIQALAVALDSRLVWGAGGSVNVPAGVSAGTAVVTFPAGYFTANPYVVAVSRTSTWFAAVTASSTTSATVAVRQYVDNTAGNPSVGFHVMAQVN